MNRVVVTGAASGLGLAIAEKFLGAGSRVLLVDNHPDTEAIAGRLSPNAVGFHCDLAASDCGNAILARAESALGGCDVLVNNAAWSYHCAFLDLTVDEFDRLVAVNQRAPFFLSQAFARHLPQMNPRPDDPCIVHLSSVTALSGNTNMVCYGGTKGAIEAMTRAMAVELAPLGIRVNAVRPGVIDTANFRSAVASGKWDPEKYWKEFLIASPASPFEIADAVFFLCTASSRHVTGSIWTMDGGFTAH